jgi:hypothetical protein
MKKKPIKYPNWKVEQKERIAALMEEGLSEEEAWNAVKLLDGGSGDLVTAPEDVKWLEDHGFR